MFVPFEVGSSAAQQLTEIGERSLCLCLRFGQVGLCRGQLHSCGVRRSPELRQLGLDRGQLSRLPLQLLRQVCGRLGSSRLARV